MTQTLDGLLPAVRDAADGLMQVDDMMVGGQASSFRTRPNSRVTGGGEILSALLTRSEGSPTEAVRVRGRLLVPSDEAYSTLADRLEPLGCTPVLRREPDGRDLLLVLPGKLRQADQRVRVAGILFLLTVLSCLFVGAQMTDQVVESGRLNLNLLQGWQFAVPLLTILVCHEFGHYIVARRLGTPVSLPYFIPLPLPGSFGTMGAVINMVAPARNRRQLLAIAAAGPLAGLIVAIPVLWLGLGMSRVLPLPPGGYQVEGNSILYAVMKFIRFGEWLPGGGRDVFIGPVAWAGWAGLLLTGLNLLPAGQLDGGHIVDALGGERWSRIMLIVVLVALAGLSILWTGWLLWVGLVFLFGRVRVPPLDDITPLTPAEKALAVCMIERSLRSPKRRKVT